MERPNIKDFLSEDTTPSMVNNMFLENNELYNYIQALDNYIDDLNNRLEKLVMPKIAEETARFCIQELREEFLLNTQNYPKEYHAMFYKKAERVIDKINEKYNSNFSA